jgi:hypothetical protein
VIACIEALMRNDTAGDPITGLKWTHRTTDKIAAELAAFGIHVSANTVARLLKQMGYSLRVNHKKLARGASGDRDAQFVAIAELREACAANGDPIISVDTKKKELVGNFKNAGAAWNRSPVAVNDHDFRSDAIGMAVPYGIYDLAANKGTIFVGNSHDTACFAVDSIETWWLTEGRLRYPQADKLTILADGGGSNGSRCRSWKLALHEQLCLRHGIAVTVAHYPPGASKWNPIEHRLFSEVSKNWAGRPLDSYDTIINHLRTTTTRSGLSVRAHLVDKQYEKGIQVSDAQMRALPISSHKTLPLWNYTLSPH